MKKFTSAIPLLVFIFPIIGLAQDDVICTMEYMPVCGEIDTGIRCITEPCPSTEMRTFGNRCQLDAAHATYHYNGECAPSEPTADLPAPTPVEPPTDTDQEIQDILDQIKAVEQKIEELNEEVPTLIEDEENASWLRRTWDTLINLIVFWD